MLQKLRRAMVDPIDRFSRISSKSTRATSLRTKDDPIAGGQGRSAVGKLHFIGAIELSPDAIRAASVSRAARLLGAQHQRLRHRRC